MSNSSLDLKANCVFFLLLLCASSISNPAVGQDPKLEFNRDIRPILSDRCFPCHGPDDKKRESDLRFDLEANAKRDLGGYKAIVPGKPGDSELVRRIFSDDPGFRMPPEISGKLLSEDDKNLLKTWIQQGATFQKHWSFQEIVRPHNPSVTNTSWIRNDIDYFVLAELEKRQVKPSPVADRQTLIRRLYLDLIGLLPTPAKVNEFVNDRSGNGYEFLIDRLLDSKHFGERMGRHWLDLARLADSNGYANDGLRSVWPYRDWVIKAINDDMPFDQFTIEQLAGDLLPNATESQKVATGFHRNTPHQTEGGSDPEQYRVERTKNRTDTTGAVWLGLTVGCAQCHSHKFDPISHEEYYQLYAFFNNADEPTLTLSPSAETNSKIDLVNKDITAIKSKLESEKKRTKELEAQRRKLDWQPVKFESIQSLQGATLNQSNDLNILASGKNPSQDTYELSFDATQEIKSIQIETLTDPSLPHNGPGRAGNGNFVLAELQIKQNGKPVRIVSATADHSQQSYAVPDAFDGDFKTGWAINVQSGKLNVNRTAAFSLEKQIQGTIEISMTTYERGSGYNIGKFRISTSHITPDKIDSKVKEFETLLNEKQNELEKFQQNVASTLAISERAEPRESFVQIRGDFLDRGAKVLPATFSSLHPLTGNSSSELQQPNRLDLAKWIVSKENPLTPRVAANQIWQRMFGVGLVDTENDFGYQGSLPTHPALLDYLATDLIDNGWKIKRIYKKIAMSATYRQSSKFRPQLHVKDPTNKWLARQLRYRVEGEIVRDLALTASGLLSRKMGGPSVFPPIPPNVIGTSSANHQWPESKGEDRYRRGVYTAIYRANVYPMLSVFDGPDRDNACTRRTLSNTPLQALTIANDASFMEMARAYGKRIVAESKQNDSRLRIRNAFEIAMSRKPSDKEFDRIKSYFDSLLGFYRTHPKETRQIAGEDNAELAGWVSVARVMLNLDEFITRE